MKGAHEDGLGGSGAGGGGHCGEGRREGRGGGLAQGRADAALIAAASNAYKRSERVIALGRRGRAGACRRPKPARPRHLPVIAAPVASPAARSRGRSSAPRLDTRARVSPIGQAFAPRLPRHLCGAVQGGRRHSVGGDSHQAPDPPEACISARPPPLKYILGPLSDVRASGGPSVPALGAWSPPQSRSRQAALWIAPAVQHA